jgi:hypothetical protein
MQLLYRSLGISHLTLVGVISSVATTIGVHKRVRRGRADITMSGAHLTSSQWLFLFSVSLLGQVQQVVVVRRAESTED